MSAGQSAAGAVSHAGADKPLAGSSRVMLFAAASLFIHIAYALYHAFLGITQGSMWFIVMWAYYTIFGTIRFSAILCAYKKSAGMDVFVMRSSGILLLLSGVVLSGVVYLSLAQDIAAQYGEITMITIATYTFAKITVSIVKAVRQRRISSPFLTVIRNIGYAEAAASLFTLQRSMVASFGEMAHRHLLDILTGGAVCLFVAVLGVGMIGKSRKEGSHDSIKERTEPGKSGKKISRFL